MRWQVFSLLWTRSHRFVIFSPTESSRCNRIIPLGATDFTTGKTFCHLFILTFDPAPLNESFPLQASHFYQCFVLCLKDQTHSRQIPEGPSWKLMSKGEREITSKLITSTGGERDLQGERILKKRVILKDPRCLVFKRRDAECLLEGKTCSYVLICISSVHSFLWALILCSLSSPSIPC